MLVNLSPFCLLNYLQQWPRCLVSLFVVNYFTLFQNVYLEKILDSFLPSFFHFYLIILRFKENSGMGGSYLLQDISVELFLAIPEKLSNHLPAQPLPLQQEVSDSNGRVRDKTTRDQEVDSSFWVPARRQPTAEKQKVLKVKQRM